MGNSVIYRPAYDAEVEYLESTGTQYIDTLLKVNTTTSQFECEIIPTNVDGTQAIFGSRNTVNYADDSSCNIFIISAKFRVDWYAGSGISSNTIYANTSYIISITRGEYIINGTSHTYSNSISVNQNYNFLIGNFSNGSTEPYPTGFIGKWKWVKLYDNGNLIFDGIPVRVGSVGYMYDKISGRLFGNKGTGNFVLGNDVVNAVIPQQRCVLYFGNQRSVGFERIYEEYEWIIGDNVAYIDGLDYNLWTNTLEIKIGKVEGNCQYFGLKLVYDTQADTRSYFQMMTSGSVYRTYFRDIKNRQGWCGWFNISDMPSEVIFSYYNENGKAVGIINGVKTYDTISTNTLTESVWNKYVPINTKDGNNIYTKLAKVSYIRELLPNNTYRSNLIPCKLLQSIPAILDGNGIARQAGECGMWDKVSNKFYGNVANSGTFKAVNLAEGVDYEVHQWLKAICPVNTTMMTLSIGSQNFNWKVKIEQLGNSTYFRSDCYSYFITTNTSKIVHIWDIPNEVTIFSAQTARTEGMTVVISSTSESLTFNGEIIPKYEFPDIRIWIHNAINGVRDTITYTSSITIDGIERYIPVKLLKSIPAKYDANGIARPAGTCGMWDKVNDVFYGNVASSGTFTVSND